MAITNTPGAFRYDKKFYAKWAGFATNAETGGAVKLPSGTLSVSIQAIGTFAGGLSIRAEGSNDGGTTWSDLGVTAFTAAGQIRTITPLPDLIRVASTAGGGGGNVDLHLIAYVGK